MQITDLDMLDRLLQLCHKRNVHTITLGDLTVQMSPQDAEATKPAQDPNVFLDPVTGLPMSDEEIMYYSAQTRR